MEIEETDKEKLDYLYDEITNQLSLMIKYINILIKSTDNTSTEEIYLLKLNDALEDLKTNYYLFLDISLKYYFIPNSFL